MRIAVTFAVLFLIAPVFARGTDAPARLKIVCLGDSITDGDTYPLLLRQALGEAGRAVPITINAGIGGDGIVGMRQRLDGDVLAYHPDVVLVSAGINDLGRMTPAEYERNVGALLDALAAAKVRAVVLTLTTLSPEFAAKRPGLAEFNAVLRRAARDRKLALGDVASYMEAEAGRGTRLNEADGCHLNFDGYRQMSRGVLDGLGFADVPVPLHAKIEPVVGLVRNWRIRGVASETPLTAEGVAALKPDDTWQAMALPLEKPVGHWFWDQQRARGLVNALPKLIGPAKRYQGVSIVHSEAEREVYVNTGASLRAVWVNGQQVYKPSGREGDHLGRQRIKARLAAGENTIVIESGDSFFFAITDAELW